MAHPSTLQAGVLVGAMGVSVGGAGVFVLAGSAVGVAVGAAG
jgi:hypothetical protein